MMAAGTLVLCKLLCAFDHTEELQVFRVTMQRRCCCHSSAWQVTPTQVLLICLRLQYDRVIIGGAVPAPAYALGVLLTFTAAMGLLDGVSIGAVYGEAGDTTCQMLHLSIAIFQDLHMCTADTAFSAPEANSKLSVLFKHLKVQSSSRKLGVCSCACLVSTIGCRQQYLLPPAHVFLVAGIVGPAAEPLFAAVQTIS
jgi:hypothetical protein